MKLKGLTAARHKQYLLSMYPADFETNAWIYTPSEKYPVAEGSQGNVSHGYIVGNMGYFENIDLSGKTVYFLYSYGIFRHITPHTLKKAPLNPLLGFKFSTDEYWDNPPFAIKGIILPNTKSWSTPEEALKFLEG